MKYTYAYKTSDGIRHEDSMHASSREEVFEALRAKGIKAIKVVAADGSKANGEVRGMRLRVVVLLVILAAAIAGVVAYLGGIRSVAPQSQMPSEKTVTEAATATQHSELAPTSPRHQIYGDPAVMEAFDRGEFTNVLHRTGDQLLAVFAQPGRFMCAKNTNPRLLTTEQAEALNVYVKDQLAVEQDVEVMPDEPREIRELKEIVNGMRKEMREYLANGNGTPRSYWRRLNERTLQESQIFERTRRELEHESSSDVWEEKNAALRRLGLRTIPNPNE